MQFNDGSGVMYLLRIHNFVPASTDKVPFSAIDMSP